ncbi:MAG: hypothetical protein U0174_07215 [Polyangiaceae bacterium]
MKTGFSARWFALACVVLNVVFNYASELLLPLPSMRSMSDRYATFFTPAPYAFSIWGVIYLGLLTYAIAAVLPKYRTVALFDRLSYPLAVTNLLASVWVVAFRADRIDVSVVVVLGMLLLSGHMFWRAHHAARNREAAFRLTVPFALLFGWVTVATLANLGAYGVFLGGLDSPTAAPSTAVAFMIIAVLAASAVVFRTHDFVYPAVVTWALVAIAAEQWSTTVVATAAGFGAALCAVLATYSAYARGKRPRFRHTTRNGTPAHRRQLESYI